MAEKDRFRNKEVRVKLSDDEYITLQNKCGESGMNLSDALRSLIVYGRINAKWLDEYSCNVINELNEKCSQIIYEINKIGVNINQIAYRANSNLNATENDLQDTLQEVRYLTSVLMDSIDEVREILYANNTYS